MQTGDRHPAIDDVEQLQEQLVEIRAHRRRVEAEFDAFTQGFRTGEPPPRPLLPPSPIGRGRTRAAGGFVGLPAAETQAEAPQPVHSVPQALADSPRTPRALHRVNGRALAVAGIAVVVVAVAAIGVRGRFSQPGSETPVTVQPTASTTEPAPAPAPAPATATPPARAQGAEPGVNVTMITKRRVWMRVTVDGRRAFEREVGAGEQIPLRGDRSIVLRAGDAGAVAVIWNGRDAGFVGRDGVVATREFTRDAPPR